MDARKPNEGRDRKGQPRVNLAKQAKMQDIFC